MSEIRLSILDQSRVEGPESHGQALANTVRLAQQAEQWGYFRYWLAEHHDSDHMVGSAPEVLAAYLAAKTTKIRIASGGIMLQNYSPYKVAEQFNVLSALTDGRIDLGVGKSPGGFPASTAALLEGRSGGRNFTEKLEELVRFARGEFPDDHPYSAIKVTPFPEKKPELYLLGGSVESARMAAAHDMSLVYAYSVNGDLAELAEARRVFASGLPEGSTATFHLSPLVFVADTDEEAERHIAFREAVKVVLDNGQAMNLPSMEKALDYVKGLNAPYRLVSRPCGIIAGTRDKVAIEIRRLAAEYDIRDFVIFSPIPDFNQRLRSYDLLRQALFGE